ncbi:hypothetical protein ACOME3_003784 [Neoechinorhynchus agilis]
MSSKPQENEAVPCIICLERYTQSFFLKSSECNHAACKSCMIKWICSKNRSLKDSTCFLCRSNLFSSDGVCRLVKYNGESELNLSIENLKTVRKIMNCRKVSQRIKYIKRFLYRKSVFVAKIEDPKDPSRGTDQQIRPCSPEWFKVKSSYYDRIFRFVFNELQVLKCNQPNATRLITDYLKHYHVKSKMFRTRVASLIDQEKVNQFVHELHMVCRLVPGLEYAQKYSVYNGWTLQRLCEEPDKLMFI